MTKLKKVLFGCIGLYIFATLSLAHAQDAQGLMDLSQDGMPGNGSRKFIASLI